MHVNPVGEQWNARLHAQSVPLSDPWDVGPGELSTAPPLLLSSMGIAGTPDELLQELL